MEETLSDYEDYYYNYSESNCSQINSTSNFDENREDLIKDLDLWLKNVAILMIGIIGFLGKYSASKKSLPTALKLDMGCVHKAVVYFWAYTGSLEAHCFFST